MHCAWPARHLFFRILNKEVAGQAKRAFRSELPQKTAGSGVGSGRFRHYGIANSLKLSRVQGSVQVGSGYLNTAPRRPRHYGIANSLSKRRHRRNHRRRRRCRCWRRCCGAKSPIATIAAAVGSCAATAATVETVTAAAADQRAPPSKILKTFVCIALGLPVTSFFRILNKEVAGQAKPSISLRASRKNGRFRR